MVRCESCVYSEVSELVLVEHKYREHSNEVIGLRRRGGELFCSIGRDMNSQRCISYRSKYDSMSEDDLPEKTAFEVLEVLPWSTTDAIRESYLKRWGLGLMVSDNEYLKTLDKAFCEVCGLERRYRYIKKNRIKV